MPFKATSAPCALTTRVFVFSENCGPSRLCTTTETFRSIRRLRRLFNLSVGLVGFGSYIQNQHKALSPVRRRMSPASFHQTQLAMCSGTAEHRLNSG